MLRINGHLVDVRHYPDGAPLLQLPFPQCPSSGNVAEIDWRFENNEELAVLIFITRHLQRLDYEVHLFMPYIPNARMDRVKDSEDVFTLKYFAEVINFLNFKTVTVLDPHSSVSTALIDRLQVVTPEKYVMQAVDKIGEQPVFYYPDEGAMKRYSTLLEGPYLFGVKTRDWKKGEIKTLETIGELELIKDNTILIVDDISSKGGTFYYAAKQLKKLGAGKIYLFVTHCENTIRKGNILTTDYIEKVFTTNSIYALDEEKVEVIPL